MANVFLDGVRLDIADDGGATVGELLGVLEREIGAGGRLISGVKIDGARADASAVSNERLSALTELSLTTVPFAVMAADGFRLMAESASSINGMIEAYVREVRVRGGESPSLKPVFDGLIDMVKTIEAIARGDRFYNAGIFREDPAAFCDELAVHCETVRKAEERRDPITAADALEYEITPLISSMQSRLLAMEMA